MRTKTIPPTETATQPAQPAGPPLASAPALSPALDTVRPPTVPTPLRGNLGRCPIPHDRLSHQKTAPLVEPTGTPVEQDADGVWHIRGFNEARAVLRSDAIKQAGFKAETMDQAPIQLKKPVLFMDGEQHRDQRRQTARFFTPATTQSQYQQLMEDYADQVIAQFIRKRHANLGDLSLQMAVKVAAQVVGLTDSRWPGMDKRIAAFTYQNPETFGWSPRKLYRFLKIQWQMLRFYFLDVQPAIRARKRNPRADVISHLIASNYNGPEILIECITYGTAGMVTTREFISVAAWHCLTQPDYREFYLSSDQETRYQFLHELLRLEPVVGRLYRRVLSEIEFESQGQQITIPAGDLIDLHLYAINADETIVGEQPLSFCPERELQEMRPRVPAYVMGFGDGEHRCPGSYIAIQETDVFLQRLLALDGLRLEREPSVSYNDLIKGYEVRGLLLTLDA